MYWIETKTDAEALRRSEALWTPIWVTSADGTSTGTIPGPAKERGLFWADAIKDLHDAPTERLEMARRHLPLPGAFREMQIARRRIIRDLKKEGKPLDEELRQLHYWAALNSWCIPYSAALGEPGFNVLESTPYATLASLDLTYDVIGCDLLGDLNKTDRKMMRDVWGEPMAHTTAHALYGDLWRARERMLIAHRNEGAKTLLSFVSGLDV